MCDASIWNAYRRKRVCYESSVYVCLNVGARVLGRTYDLMTALALSAIFLLLDSPAYLYSSSFLLSFGAVVGLGAVSPHLIRITGAKGKAGKALISSLSVQAATLPVMLVFFGEVSVIGILLNLFVLPTVGGVLISGLCCSVLGLFSVNAGRAAAVPGRILLWLYEKVCMFAGKLPFCTWIGGLPEIWQSISYYLLLASGIILAYVMASGIQKKKKISWLLGKSVRELGQNQRSVQESCKKGVSCRDFSSGSCGRDFCPFPETWKGAQNYLSGYRTG